MSSPDSYVITEADRAHALGSQELKPCPFCGAWAISAGTVNPSTKLTVYRVLCTSLNCQAQTFSCSADPAEARTSAVSRWNRRAA